MDHEHTLVKHSLTHSLTYPLTRRRNVEKVRYCSETMARALPLALNYRVVAGGAVAARPPISARDMDSKADSERRPWHHSIQTSRKEGEHGCTLKCAAVARVTNGAIFVSRPARSSSLSRPGRVAPAAFLRAHDASKRAWLRQQKI